MRIKRTCSVAVATSICLIAGLAIVAASSADSRNGVKAVTFNRLKNQAAIPKGTKLMVTSYFDNSAKNKYNPDPTQVVRFGEPTYDEMMIGFIDYTVDKQHLRPAAAMGSGGSAQK